MKLHLWQHWLAAASVVSSIFEACSSVLKRVVGLLTRGMLEPAQAAMCAMAFGMPSANNFDIGEGCAAYIRAVEVRAPGWAWPAHCPTACCA